jgi:hypothetical protein
MKRTISCKINVINLFAILGILSCFLLFPVEQVSDTRDPEPDLTGIIVFAQT